MVDQKIRPAHRLVGVVARCSPRACTVLRKGGTPTGRNKYMWTKLLAAIGGGAVIASALVVAATADPGQAVAGSGNGAVNTFEQPTLPAMSTGATATAVTAATTVATR